MVSAAFLRRSGGGGVTHAKRFELAEHPAVSGSKRRVASIDGEEGNQARRRGPALGLNHDELSRSNVAPHEVLGQRAPTEVGSQEGVLGVKVRHAPGSKRQDALIGNAGFVSL